jgi:octopine/nopaline transport system substrate-binding protein
MAGGSLLRAALACSLLVLAGAASAKDWKTVVIGMEGGYDPYNLTDPNGKIVGFEPDLAMDVCARIKVECKIIAQDWDGMIPGLQAGKFDVIMDGMSITDERKQTIDFSVPYANVPAALATAKASPLAKLSGAGTLVNFDKDKATGEATLKALKDALKGKTIGVQVSTTHATFASNNLKDVATIKEYKTTDERDLDLKSERIDAVLDDETEIAAMLGKDDAKDFTEFGPHLTGGDFGIGVGMGLRKSDADLTAKFDAAIKAAIADGSVKNYSLKWFKIDTTP